MTSSGENSDREGDTFEDARDSTPIARSLSASSRSLTNQRPGSASGSQTRSRLSDHSVEPDSPTGGGDDVNGDLETRTSPLKSPPKAARKISTVSLDEVDLEDVESNEAASASSPASAKTKTASLPQATLPSVPPRSLTGSPQKQSSFSGSLPTMPWASSQTAINPNSTAPAPPPTRKLTSPFAWLSRNASATTKEPLSPPMPPASHSIHQNRRDTASSVATVGSNPEMMLSKIDDEDESDGSLPQHQRKTAKNSLHDRFKLLRMREEAGITSLGDDGSGSPIAGSALAGLIGRSTGLGMGVGSPTSFSDEKEHGLASQAPLQSPSATPHMASPAAVPVSSNLAPGTAAGVSAGPSAMHDPDAPVDWDLWQSVVYEGPAAVARSSPEEMNRAIAAGIPSAIRGVVWQVLAHSKNEDLEGVYKELLSRGTDKIKIQPIETNISAKLDPAHIEGGSSGKEKDSMTSSTPSLHSGHSTPGASAVGGISTPGTSQKDDNDAAAKLQASLLAEKKKRRDEEAALQKLERAIKRDLGARTSYSKYVASSGLQDGLFGVCKAYALFDEAVGYAQGMNFLIMPLLFNMPEDEAFCLLVRLMNHYHIREMFIQDMPGLHLHLYQFERLLEDLEPALFCHLQRRGVSPQLYATQWFLTLFAYRFPLQLVLRIYDLVLSEGLEGAILKFGIVLMQKNAQTLMGMSDMAALTTFLKEKLFDVYIDRAPSASSILESGFFGNSGGSDKEVYRADVMVQDACAIKLSPATLKAYRAEWEEKVRLEKERDAEIDALKTVNAGLSLKVRSLEERAEKSDTEHVQIASEVVRIKVENEELQDKNESLSGQVDELKGLVEKQPEEVEARLKDEMDRIMKRNLEVHNENRALEEQLTEMEKALVNAKLQYAEINSNHESLKQKWNDLRKALGD
ncbi:MAG: GTPase-activating protein [Piccolia ochrophora]|nr:MAG: GTPase-activating protein [Piccolia ochrophora]